MTSLLKWLKRHRSVAIEPPSERHVDKVREFIYLDEVSVYSLASSAGNIPAVSLTESVSAENSDTTGATGGATVPLVAKADLHATLARKRSSGTQIERKFNIQATFDQLHHDLKPNLILSGLDGVHTPRQEADPQGLMDRLRDACAARPSVDLKRGSLVELNLDLSSHRAYELTSVMSDFSEMMSDGPDFAGVSGDSMPQSLREFSQLMNRFLVDLVPIEGVATDYTVVDWNGQPWAAPTAAIDAIPALDHLKRSELVIVGVTEKDLFWKNTRRVLYSGLKYDAMARIAHSGLKTTWTPVKLLEVFERALPDVDMSGFDFFLDPDTAIAAGQNAKEASEQMGAIALDLYLRLADHHQITPSPAELSRTESLFSVMPFDTSSISAKLAQLGPVVDLFYLSQPQLTKNMNSVAPLRIAAIEYAASQATQASIVAAAPPKPQRYYLEVEFIAMYW